MASEPRNYPDYVFVAYDEDFSAQTYDIAVSLEPGNLVGRPVKYIRHDLNTRPAPAATDTGLETVETQWRCAFIPNDKWVNSKQPENMRDGDIETRELVTRSQAEELLAAERAEKERLSALIHENGTPRFNAVCERAEKAEAEAERWHRKAMDAGVIVHSDGTTSHPMRKERDDLKADNAEKDREIGQLKAALGADAAQFMQSLVDECSREIEKRKALEAKLAAAEKALERMVSEYDEVDLSHDEPPSMTSAVMEARAVLGGKL